VATAVTGRKTPVKPPSSHVTPQFQTTRHSPGWPGREDVPLPAGVFRFMLGRVYRRSDSSIRHQMAPAPPGLSETPPSHACVPFIRFPIMSRAIPFRHRWVRHLNIPTTTGPRAREIGGPTPHRPAAPANFTVSRRQRAVALPWGNRLLHASEQMRKESNPSLCPNGHIPYHSGTTGGYPRKLQSLHGDAFDSLQFLKFSGDGASELAAPPLPRQSFWGGGLHEAVILWRHCH